MIVEQLCMEKTQLKKLLESRGTSVTWLSKQTGISYANLTLIVNGKRVPSLENALRIARVLNTDVESLWGYILED
jgi:plasmid maintenance system antidote protein VapI